MTTETTEEAAKTLARTLRSAEAAFGQAMLRVEAEAELMSEAEFWLFVEHYRRQIIRWGAKEAVRCFHNALKPYGPMRMVRFAKTWRAKVDAAYEPLFLAVWGRSDDGFADLIDALPLVGRKVFERALEEPDERCLVAEAEASLKEAVKDMGLFDNLTAVEKTGELMRLVFQGENAHAMQLEDAGRSGFKSAV